MEIDIQKIISIVKKKWKLFVICGLLGALVAFLFANYMVAPKYTSQVRFFVSVKNAATITTGDNTGGAAGANTQATYTIKMIPTYLTFLQTESFYTDLDKATGSKIGVGSLKRAVTYTQTAETSVFAVSVTTEDPKISKTISAYISEAIPKVIAQNDTLVDAKVIDPATSPVEVTANSMLYCAVGLILGLALAFAYVLLRDMLDVHFKTEEDITSRYSLPLLGSIPDYENKSSRKAGRK